MMIRTTILQNMKMILMIKFAVFQQSQRYLTLGVSRFWRDIFQF